MIVHPRIVRNISSILPLDSLQPVTNTERSFITLEEKLVYMLILIFNYSHRLTKFVEDLHTAMHVFQ